MWRYPVWALASLIARNPCYARVAINSFTRKDANMVLLKSCPCPHLPKATLTELF